MSKTIVWNVSPATQAQSTTVSLYGKTIAPGKSRKLDTAWIDLNPTPLQALVKQRMIHVGASLPGWYRKAKEDLMARYKLKNDSGKDKLLKAEGFHPTIIRHGETMPVDAEKFDLLDEEALKDLQVEDTGEASKPAKDEEPPQKEESSEEQAEEQKEPEAEEAEESEEEPAEEPKVEEKPKAKPKTKKRSTPKRGKKAAK